MDAMEKEQMGRTAVRERRLFCCGLCVRGKSPGGPCPDTEAAMGPVPPIDISRPQGTNY